MRMRWRRGRLVLRVVACSTVKGGRTHGGGGAVNLGRWWWGGYIIRTTIVTVPARNFHQEVHHEKRNTCVSQET